MKNENGKRTRGGLSNIEAALVVAMIVLGTAGAYYIGATQDPAPIVQTVTVTTTTTTTPVPPQSISIAGGYSTTTTGTSAQSMAFVSQTTGISYPAEISNGQYSASLPNQDSYVVEIHWNGLFGVDNGNCNAGLLPLYYQFDPGQALSMNWKC